MPYQAFSQYFPKTAARETRTITNIDNPAFPKGEYGFTELFCDECDCRRAVIKVLNIEFDDPVVATISFGWGTKSFYTRWFGQEDQQILETMMGVSLMFMTPQSEYAEIMLAIFKEILENDPEYEKRIRRHYSKFRKKIKHLSN